MARTALIARYLAYAGQSDDVTYQVAGACLKAAQDIQAEDAGTENHANRLLWAAAVEANPKAIARSMVGRVLENATIAADVDNATDSDMQFVVNSLIDEFATGG